MLDINEFKENLIEFECVRVRDARTVWINDAASGDLEDEMNKEISADSFARHFAYVSKSNRCFDEAKLDVHDRRVYMAERYGGRGVGTNGGSGRAGNFGQFQMKGIGPNVLARGDSEWHSYGSLNIMDAAYEAIYSTVLNQILPSGCARIYGLILTSDSGAFRMNNWGTKEARILPAPGAILVRERVLRPAHFMYAELFTPPKSMSLTRESTRIRLVHRRLKEKFENDHNYIQFIGKFILSSAKQFAFAKAGRIAHGGVTPSNICLDGRWIDMTEARFLSGGKNFRGLTPFFEEPQVIVEVVKQLLYVYGKCNCTQFNIEPLLRYYGRVFDNCFAYYALSFLGLPEPHLDKIAESEDGKVYSAAYARIIHKTKQPIADVPEEYDPEDPVIAFMRLSYLAAANNDTAVLNLSGLMRCSVAEAESITVAFRKLLHRAISQQREPLDQGAFRSYCIAFAIKALRWAYLSAYFYRGRIKSELYSRADDHNFSELGNYIQDCIDQSRWIFDTATSGNVIIAKTRDIQIAYDQSKRIYTLTGICKHMFERYADCLAYVNANYSDPHISGTLDISAYLRDIGDVLGSLETMTFIPA